MIPAAQPPLLDVRDFGLEFRTRSGTVRALQGVNLQLHKGEIVGLVGESGSGKSVLSYAMLGISDTAAKVTGGQAGRPCRALAAAMPRPGSPAAARTLAGRTCCKPTPTRWPACADARSP